jgi:hypothetical protein
MAAESETGSFERRRLLVIVGGMVVAWLLGGAATVLFLYSIPGLKVEISNRNAEIAVLQPDVKKVQATLDAIEKLKQKIVIVENIDRSRVRINRILSHIGSVISAHEGMWLKHLAFSRARDPKRHQIILQGYVSGGSEQEMQKSIPALMDALEAQFVVMSPEKKPLENAPLRATFDRPILIEHGGASVTIPASHGRPARNLPCRYFLIEINYDLLPALTAVQPREKTDDFKFDKNAIKRDPFVCPVK